MNNRLLVKHILYTPEKEVHKKDSESAPQTIVADELKENLEAVENFKGSRDEKLVVLYCKKLGINYKNLSEEEFRWLIRILQKSKKMGTPISQRKNGKEKPLLHGFLSFHVAAVCAVVIQLNFRNDKLEFNY